MIKLLTRSGKTPRQIEIAQRTLFLTTVSQLSISIQRRTLKEIIRTFKIQRLLTSYIRFQFPLIKDLSINPTNCSRVIVRFSCKLIYNKRALNLCIEGTILALITLTHLRSFNLLTSLLLQTTQFSSSRGLNQRQRIQIKLSSPLLHSRLFSIRS